LIVGFKKDSYSRTCLVEDINWIHRVPDAPMGVLTRIRYRHQAAPSLITLKDHLAATVAFEKPQNAVTPGQAAVFYDRDEVLGSGWITEQLS
jgi:tRNA-specific 2-thiouridylase